MKAEFLKAKHANGLGFDAYIATDPNRAANWQAKRDAVSLEDSQRAYLGGLIRRMPVICLSGIWCGDCAIQCPMIAAIADASPLIDLVFLDRDEHSDLSNEVRIAGGNRVPTVIWLSEEFEFVHLLGDRTLSRYRRMAATQIGPSCPLPSFTPPADENVAVLAEWIAEFERVQLILRLSPRLRKLHGD